ncbi:hypothetical protein KEM54_006387 [Ascosphaera aggregata]|nr:hypothetical protein KEM54_006387 [Ascosphaera aggregata]
MVGAQLSDAREQSPDVGRDEDVIEKRGQSENPGLSISSEQWSIFIDKALDFLASADSNTLTVVFAVAFALTYGIFGRLGLILIGVLAGVVLHAFWDSGQQENQATVLKRRKELSIEVAARVLRWHDEDRLVEMTEVNSIKTAGQRLDYTDFNPAITAALASFTEAAVRVHVEKPTDIFIQFLTNTASISIVFLSEIAGALQSASLSGSACTTAEAIQRYLEKYPESSLAGILSRPQQHRKIKSVSADFLETFLRPEEHDCGLLRTFLSEVLAGLVIENVIEQCSSTEVINSWLIYLLEAGETDLMQAIDEGVGGVAQNGDQRMLDSNNSTPRESIDSNGQGTKALSEMDEATREAKRLSAMIAADEVLQKQGNREDAVDTSRVSEATPKEYETIHEGWENVSERATRTPSSPTSSSSGWEKMTHPETSLPVPHESQIPGSSTPLHAEESTDTGNISPASDSAKLAGPSPAIPLNPQLPTPIVKTINPGPISFYNATVSLIDDSTPCEKTKLRSKPSHEYLLQIEPSSTRHSGWVITRRYADFEILHEGLKRISGVSGAAEFTLKHPDLPRWKSQTKACLRNDLEQYLQDALRYETLADSERMKKFLQKETEPVPPKASPKSPFSIIKPSNTNVFENMGKGVLEALSNTPRDITKGGKAMFEGMSNVFGQRHSLDTVRDVSGETGSPRTSNEVKPSAGNDIDSPPRRAESEIIHPSVASDPSPSPKPGHSRTWSVAQCHPSDSLSLQSDEEGAHSRLSLQLPQYRQTRFIEVSQPSAEKPMLGGVAEDDSEANSSSTAQNPLTGTSSCGPQQTSEQDDVNDQQLSRSSSIVDKTSPSLNESPAPFQTTKTSEFSVYRKSDQARMDKERDSDTTLSEEELDVSVELLFAIINETYSLSSAWAIRKKLLNAAKNFFLKPGNPGLESIRTYLEESIIRKNSSDETLAANIESLRQSALPTPQELANMPPPKTEEELEELRKRARKIFVTRGMPKALMGVMGTSATEEALGRIFDCLQIRDVARDETLSDQIVYYFSQVERREHAEVPTIARRKEEKNERLRQIGLAQGMVAFARNFSDASDIDTVETDRGRLILKELEHDWWILCSVEFTRISTASPATDTATKSGIEHSSRDVSPAHLLLQQLLKAHSIFLLHHGTSLVELYERTPRDIFCSLLDRFWTGFVKTWDVLLHGNPSADLFDGIRVCGAGELGFGVGEEEWGSGERDVLEGIIAETNGLVDIVASRFGDGPEDESKESGTSRKATQFGGEDSWLGQCSHPAATDGVFFSGAGAISRDSVVRISQWMVWIFRYGVDAYGVRRDSGRKRHMGKVVGASHKEDRRARRVASQPLHGIHAPRSSSPGIPPPLIAVTETAQSEATPDQYSKHCGAEHPLQRGRQASLPDALGFSTDTLMKFLTLGYGSTWGNTSSDDTSHATSEAGIEEVTGHSHASSSSTHGQNDGRFVLGLRGDLNTEQLNNSQGEHRILLRRLVASMAGEQSERSTQDGPSSPPTRIDLTAVVYARQPFMFTFLFDPQSKTLASPSIYRSIHHQLGPLWKPLLSATSPNRFAEKAQLPSFRAVNDSNTQPLYDIVFDPVMQIVHSNIPNIPEVGAPSTEQLSRLDALNIHTQILQTFMDTRTSPKECERTIKTNRGWWILWLRMRQLPTAQEEAEAPLQSKEAFLVRKAPDNAPDGMARRSTRMLRDLGGSSDTWTSPVKLAEIGLDVRRYVESLLDFNR